MPLHCSSWLCFRCIILLLTHQTHLFGYVKSNTSAFSKNKQQQQNPKQKRVSTEKVNVQEIPKADVRNCALTDRQELISEQCGKCTCSRVQKILADAILTVIIFFLIYMYIHINFDSQTTYRHILSWTCSTKCYTCHINCRGSQWEWAMNGFLIPGWCLQTLHPHDI